MFAPLRTRQINRAAVTVAELMAVTDGDGPATRAQVDQQNRAGWTLDVPAPHGGTVRAAGVTFTAAELAQVWERATALFHGR